VLQPGSIELQSKCQHRPVDAGIVEKSEEYIYSSAENYYCGKQCGLIEVEFLL